MGDIRTEIRHQYLEEIPYTELQDGIDVSVQAAKNIEKDLLGYGVVSGGAVTPTSPASMLVSVAAILAYSATGDHLKATAGTTVDCSVDYLGVATVPGTGQIWISIFAFPDWTDGDERANGIGTVVAHTRTEAIEFAVYKGTSSLLPTNPGSGAIRVCSILLQYTTTSITAGMIYQTKTMHRDTLKTLSNKVNKDGDQITGTLTFLNDEAGNGPLVFGNAGTVSMPFNATKITGTSNPDYDEHYVIASPMINTFLKGKQLNVTLTPKVNLYHAGSVIPLWMQVIRSRFHADLMTAGNTFTEVLLVYQEVDEDDLFTGKIQIVIIGNLSFVNRFAGRPIRWLAFAGMPGGVLQ